MAFGDSPAPTGSVVNEIVEGVVYLIVTFLVIGLNVYYLRRYKSDIWGRRDVIKHLVKADSVNISDNYRLMENLRMIGIVALSLSVLFGCIAHNFWPLDTDCTLITQLTMTPWLFGKTMLYLTIILALYTNFHAFPKAVQFPTNKLLLVACITIAVISICGTGLVVSKSYSTDQRRDVDGSFPYHCFVYVDESKWRLIFGLGAIIYDCLFAFCSIKAFIIACKRLDSEYVDNSNDKALILAKYHGQKYKSVAITTGIVTFIWIFVALLGAPQFIVTSLYVINIFINIICLWLLAPYSKNDRYYKNVCTLCRACCGTDEYLANVEKAELTQSTPNDAAGDNGGGDGDARKDRVRIQSDTN